jgi:hypothetical protein
VTAGGQPTVNYIRYAPSFVQGNVTAGGVSAVAYSAETFGNGADAALAPVSYSAASSVRDID